MSTQCQLQEYSLWLILTFNALTILILSILSLFLAFKYSQLQDGKGHSYPLAQSEPLAKERTRSPISTAEASHNEDRVQVDPPPENSSQNLVNASRDDKSHIGPQVEPLLSEDSAQALVDVSHSDKSCVRSRVSPHVEPSLEDPARDIVQVSPVETSHSDKNHVSPQVEPLSEDRAHDTVIPVGVSHNDGECVQVISPLTSEDSSQRPISPVKVLHGDENRVSLQVGPEGHAHDTISPMELSYDDKSRVQLQLEPLPEDRAQFAISPDKASVKCKSIGIDGLLSCLNTLFDTSVNKSHPGVEQTLSYFTNGDHDVGMAYGCLRRIWYLKENLWENFSDCRMTGEQWEKGRRDSIKGNFIHQPRSIKPRRIWDLYAHRVIPFEFSKIDAALMKSNIAKEMRDGQLLLSQHVSVPHTWVKLPYIPPFHLNTAPGYYVAVSHSWVEGMSTTTIETDANGREWPVPLPPNLTLEALRNELLHLVPSGYIWVDILCLRQATPLNSGLEELRKKEWQIDVPTMGNIYRPCPAIVRYFNGLGICFSRSGWKDAKHWSQRAWTMQERNGADKYNDTYVDIYIDAGSPDGQPLLSVKSSEDNGTTMARHLYDNSFYSVIVFEKQLLLFKLVQMMTQRHSQNPVDKIAGLAMVIGCPKLAVYDGGIPLEHAWARFVHSIPEEYLRELFFGLPFPRWSKENGYQTWCPTWAQLSSFVQRSDSMPFGTYDEIEVKLAEDGHLDVYADVIEGCWIREPWPTSANRASVIVERTPEGGETVIKVWKEKSWEVLEAGKYTFFYGKLNHAFVWPIWMVCRESTSVPGQLEKVTTIQMDHYGSDDLKRFSKKKTVRCR